MQRKTIIFIFVFLGLGVFVFWWASNSSTDNPPSNTNPDPTITTASGDSDLTPEEVLKNLDGGEVEEPTGPLSIEIISPEGAEFIMSQARYYKAQITNFPKNVRGTCTWKYYLNEYSEEVLYQEQETQVIGGETCGFTSTFIDKRGKLRVVVTVEAIDRTSDTVLDTASAEAEYTVT